MAGRPKGALNRENKVIRDMLRAALERKGGADYFYEQAEANPTAFMSLIGKLIPAEINLGGQEDNPIEQNVTVTIVRN